MATDNTNNNFINMYVCITVKTNFPIYLFDIFREISQKTIHYILTEIRMKTNFEQRMLSLT